VPSPDVTFSSSSLFLVVAFPLLLKAELSGDRESLRQLQDGMGVRLPNAKIRSDELEDLLSSVSLYNEVEVVSRTVQVTFDEAKARGLSICFKLAQEFFVRSYGPDWTVLSRVFMIKYKQHV